MHGKLFPNFVRILAYIISRIHRHLDYSELQDNTKYGHTSRQQTSPGSGLARAAGVLDLSVSDFGVVQPDG